MKIKWARDVQINGKNYKAGGEILGLSHSAVQSFTNNGDISVDLEGYDNLVECPICRCYACAKKGHSFGVLINTYNCESCGVFHLGDDIFERRVLWKDGVAKIISDNSKKNCNAIYSYMIRHPQKTGDGIRAFTLKGERLNDTYPQANISVEVLLESYPTADDDYKLRKILSNLNIKFGKSTFASAAILPPLVFAESENPADEIRFWLVELCKAGYLDELNGLYNITLAGISFISKEIYPAETDKDERASSSEPREATQSPAQLTINNNGIIAMDKARLKNTKIATGKNVSITEDKKLQLEINTDKKSSFLSCLKNLLPWNWHK